MGLLKGPLTFSRFTVAGKLPSDFTEMVQRQIRRHAFQDLAAETQEKILGWTGIGNVLDTDFQHASYVWGDYLLFSLRIDRRSVPPSLLKLRALEAERQHLKDTGRKKIDKTAREQIRETLRQDLLRRIPPTPSFHEVCWSVSSGRLLFTSLSEKIMQDFQDLFKTSFGLAPLPFVPWNPQHSNMGKVSKIEDMPMTEGQAGDSKTPGREFLTWLWFKSEERNGMILIPGIGETEVQFVRRLVLESGDGEYSESVVCQGMHADLKEGREALRQGKKIREARLQLIRDAATWEFTFKADRFEFQSLKMPVVMDSDEEQDNRDGRVLERIYLLETVVNCMDQLFALFVALRLSETWQQEQGRMEKWLQAS
jgi:recombination associated protein RdgC